jgi:hypothetical protein
MLDNAQVAKAATGDRRVSGMLVLPKDAISIRGWSKAKLHARQGERGPRKGSEVVQTTAGAAAVELLERISGLDWAGEKRAELGAWATHVRSIVEGSID